MRVHNPDAIPTGRAVISLSCFLFVGMLENLPSTRAGPEPPRKALAKLLLSSESVTGPTIRRLRTSVQWNDREYDVDSGIDVLMNVIRGPEVPLWGRGSALAGLAMLGTQLQGRACMQELAKLYDAATVSEKGGILLCFLVSDDPRGLPLFVAVLDKEQDNTLRYGAASALVRWNVRRGVAELIHLFESTELPSGRFYPVIGDRARGLFQKLNDRKGWGFRDEEIRGAIDTRLGIDREALKRWESLDEETRKSIEAQTQGLREKFDALYFAEIRKWFAENEHRFPDWKPGDPLPEGPVEAATPKDSE